MQELGNMHPPQIHVLFASVLKAGLGIGFRFSFLTVRSLLPMRRWAKDLGIFSEPWMLEVSGVRVKLRACNAAEKEASTAANTEAVRAGMATGHAQDNHGAGEDKAKAPSSGGMFQEISRCCRPWRTCTSA